MNKYHNWINTGLIALVVILVLVGGNQSKLGGTTNYDTVDVSDGYQVDGVSVIDGSGNISLTGGSITTTSGTLSVGGIAHVYSRDATLTAASSTPCAIQLPSTSATSTLSFFSFSETVSTTTASIIDIGKATTAFATTTKLANTYSLGSGKQITLIASTTPISGGAPTANRFAPGEWVVVKQVAGPGKALSPTGVCSAIWTETD